MKTRGLIIAAAALAILAAALYWSNRREAAKEAAGGTTDAPRIINFKEADVNRINIERNQTEKISLVKLDSGDWQVAETPVLPGDSGTISSLITSVSALNSERIVQDKPADLTPYGLGKPPVEAEIGTKDGKSAKLLLGDNTPTGTSTFAMVEGDSRLFTISSTVKTNLDKAPADFADKKIFAFGYDFPQKVEMRIDKKSYAITFDGDAWKLDGTKMDSTSMQSVIARIRDLEGKSFAATGFGTPAIEFTVTATDGKRVEHAELSKSGKDYIARHDGRPAMYVVDSGLITDLEKYIGEMKVYTPPPAETSTPSTPGSAPAPSTPATPPAPAK
jgi:hypothetical protein